MLPSPIDRLNLHLRLIHQDRHPDNRGWQALFRRYITLAASIVSEIMPINQVNDAFDAIHTLAWFHAQGEDYEQKMAAALRIYAEAHKAESNIEQAPAA